MLVAAANHGLKKRDMALRSMARLKPDKPRGLLNFRDAGSMPGVWRYYPSEDLAPFVEHYWTVEWDVPEPVLRETLPHPSIHLVLEAGREELSGIHTQEILAHDRAARIACSA